MKLSPAAASAYFARPDPAGAGVLLFGADAMRIGLRRQEVIKALTGPQGADEMRLTRIHASALRTDPAQLIDALKAMGFFPGPRAVFVEDTTEAQAGHIISALETWETGDAQLIVTAGALKPASKLRKAFEAHSKAYAIGIYPGPPGRGDVEKAVQSAGLAAPTGSVMDALFAMAQDLTEGDFLQTLEKIALYKWQDPAPISIEDVARCAPMSTDAVVEDVMMSVAEGRVSDVIPVMRKLPAQGVKPVAVCIGAMRHFRSLHRAALDTSGRPPIWGPNRDRMLAQARKWGAERLEMALSILTETDLALRSAGQTAPQAAVVERALIRLAMLRARA